MHMMSMDGKRETSYDRARYCLREGLGYDFYRPSLKDPPAVLSLGKQCQEKRMFHRMERMSVASTVHKKREHHHMQV